MSFWKWINMKQKSSGAWTDCTSTIVLQILQQNLCVDHVIIGWIGLHHSLSGTLFLFPNWHILLLFGPEVLSGMSQVEIFLGQIYPKSYNIIVSSIKKKKRKREKEERALQLLFPCFSLRYSSVSILITKNLLYILFEFYSWIIDSRWSLTCNLL